MKIAVSSIICAVTASSICHAAPPPEILVPGTQLFTESITSTADGSIIIGTMGPGAIYRAKPRAAAAEAWIKAGTDGLVNVLGVFADEKAGTLWACSFTDGPK